MTQQRYRVVSETQARTGLALVKWHLWDATKPLALGLGILSSSTDRDDLVVEARQRNAGQEPVDLWTQAGQVTRTTAVGALRR